MTASIFLRVNSFTRRGYRRGSEIYFGIRFATFAKGEIFLRANEKVIKFNILDIVLDVRVFVIFGLTKKSRPLQNMQYPIHVIKYASVAYNIHVGSYNRPYMISHFLLNVNKILINF